MKRKMLKKLVCVSGLLFMTFPAWSAVPSNVFPTDGSWNQPSVTADVASSVSGMSSPSGSVGRLIAPARGSNVEP